MPLSWKASPPIVPSTGATRGGVMSCVSCKSCGVWVDADCGEGAWDKGAPFGWKCDECLAEDNEKADGNGYRVPDQEARAEATSRIPFVMMLIAMSLVGALAN